MYEELAYESKCQLLNYEEGFEAIDWDTMHTPGTENNYKRNVKMAECLTNLVVPANFFQVIYVKNKATKLVVKEKLRSVGINKTPPFVDIGIWL